MVKLQRSPLLNLLIANQGQWLSFPYNHQTISKWHLLPILFPVFLKYFKRKLSDYLSETNSVIPNIRSTYLEVTLNIFFGKSGNPYLLHCFSNGARFCFCNCTRINLVLFIYLGCPLQLPTYRKDKWQNIKENIPQNSNKYIHNLCLN